MIRIPGNPSLEWRLSEALRKRLRGRRPEKAPSQPSLSAAERMTFEMLHRQFTGRPVPGLRTAVRAARLLLRPWRGHA
jgi:hypothetical protein